MRDSESERYVRLAMAQAEEASKGGNRPFGAVIVDPANRLVMTEHNRVVERMDPSAHAELMAIRTMCRQRRTLDLSGFRLYTNAQSCPMCFACMIEVRISDLFFAAPPAPGIWPIPIEDFGRRNDNHRVRLHGGILADEAAEQLARLSR